MKIKILPVVFLACAVTKMFGQACTPDPAYVLPGVYPDPVTNIPATYDNLVAYDATVTVVTPASVVVGGFTFTYVSGQVNSVSGLPPGFSYACSSPTCSFGPGSAHCISISGNPSAAGAGSYPISVSITATVFNAFYGTVTQTDTYSGYILLINHVPVCGVPTGVGADAGVSSATIHWDDMAGDYYKIRWHKLGDPASRGSVTTSDLSYAIEGLQGCSTYKYSVSVSCEGGPYKTPSNIFYTAGCRTGQEPASNYATDEHIIDIYPNPVTDVLHANYYSWFENDQVVQLFDLNGKCISKNSMHMVEGDNSLSINVADLSSGIYIIKINDGEYTYTTKFVK